MSNDLPASHYLRSALRRVASAFKRVASALDAAAGGGMRYVARRIKLLACLACLGGLLVGAYAVYDDYARQQRYLVREEQYRREWVAGADERKAAQDRLNEHIRRWLFSQ